MIGSTKDEDRLATHKRTAAPGFRDEVRQEVCSNRKGVRYHHPQGRKADNKFCFRNLVSRQKSRSSGVQNGTGFFFIRSLSDRCVLTTISGINSVSDNRVVNLDF